MYNYYRYNVHYTADLPALEAIVAYSASPPSLVMIFTCKNNVILTPNMLSLQAQWKDFSGGVYIKPDHEEDMERSSTWRNSEQ